MTPQELKEAYKRLYEIMRTSKDVAKMKMFGAAFTEMYNKVAVSLPDVAEATIEMLTAIEYNNYVTKQEAMEVASHFINDDMAVTGSAEPTRGAHWPMDTVKAILSARGCALEDKPYYNWPALWLVMNMEYSDYADTLVELLGDKNSEKLAMACYKMAVKKLKDRDRPHFVREYFELDD